MKALRLTNIGFVVKPHGYRGDVLIRITTDHSYIIKDNESLFLIVEGRAVPFLVESADHIKPGNFVVTFRGYDSPEKISEFVGCTVQAEVKGSHATGKLDDLPLAGFTLLDGEGNIRGTIKSVAERKHQWLATVVNASGSEFLLPVHEDLIIDISQRKKTITMIIPEGIEDLS